MSFSREKCIKQLIADKNAMADWCLILKHLLSLGLCYCIFCSRLRRRRFQIFLFIIVNREKKVFNYMHNSMLTRR